MKKILSIVLMTIYLISFVNSPAKGCDYNRQIEDEIKIALKYTD